MPTSPDPGRLPDDRGFVLIEVLVSAIILVTITLGVFAALTSADKTAGLQQRRALAANVAQSELEKIRALPVEDIAALRGTRTVSYQSDVYTVTTVAKWVTDGADEPECSTRTGGLDYLRTTVTVAWKGILSTQQPVSITSLVTPSASAGGGDTGSVSVHLTNRNGDPDVGIPVTLDGPQTFTDTTNKNGCVVFGFVPASDQYKVKFNQNGWVNDDSVQNVQDPIVVTAGQTNKLQYDYDQGGFTKVTFKTRTQSALGVLPLLEYPTYPQYFALFNAGQITPPFVVNLNNQGNPTSSSKSTWDGQSQGITPGSVTPTPIFPFTSPYSVYGGTCQAVAPDSSNATFVNIPANGGYQNAGTVYLPALNIRVMSGTGPSNAGSGVIGAAVQVDTGTGCSPVWNATTVAAATGTATTPTLLQGETPDKGYPYSTNLKVCAQTGTGSGSVKIAMGGLTNKNYMNQTSVTIYMGATTSGNTTRIVGSSNAGCFA